MQHYYLLVSRVRTERAKKNSGFLGSALSQCISIGEPNGRWFWTQLDEPYKLDCFSGKKLTKKFFTFFLLVDFEYKERQILILRQCSTRKDYTRNTIRRERKLHRYMRAESFRIFIVFSMKIYVFRVNSS